MGLNTDRAYDKVYFTTVFIAHTLSRVNPKVGSYKETLDYFRTKRYYCFNCALNNNLSTEFSGGSIYTEAALNDEDKVNVVKAINLMVLRSMSDKQNNPYYSRYKGNDELLDYLDDIAELRVADDISTYKKKLLELTGNIVHVEIRITNLDTYLKDAFKEGNIRAIELPYLSKRKVTFNEALTLALKIERSEIKEKKITEILKEWDDSIGFMPASLLVEGIINQHIAAPYSMPDDSFHRYVNALYEMQMIKGLSVEKVLDSLERCREAFAGIKELNRVELSPLAEFLCQEVVSFYEHVDPLPTERDIADEAIQGLVASHSTKKNVSSSIEDFISQSSYQGLSVIERN